MKMINHAQFSSLIFRVMYPTNIRKKNIAASLSDFEGSAHKLEHVKTLNSIDFIDDSRSVNANSVWFALQNMTKPTVWITNISSVDRITDDLMDAIQAIVKAIVMLGVYSTEVYEFFASLGLPVFVEIEYQRCTQTWGFHPISLPETVGP